MTVELWTLVGLLALAFVSMPVFAFSAASSKKDPHASQAHGRFLLGGFVKRWFMWFIGPVERASLALGFGPTFYNLLGLSFGLLAGVLFVWGRIGLGGWAILLGGIADVLDGRVARARGMASPKGAFIDSTLDRFAEVAAFIGLALWFRESAAGLPLALIAMGGSLLVSYTRARGESLGVTCSKGIMQRAERLLGLGLGAIVDPTVSALVGHDGPGAVLLWVLGVIAVGTVGTAVYRTLWITARLPDAD